MIRHVVMVKLKDRTKAGEMKDLLMTLDGRVDELKSIEVGVDVVGSDRSYDLILITGFESMDSLAAYQVHPAHIEVAGPLRENAAAIAAVDYEV